MEQKADKELTDSTGKKKDRTNKRVPERQCMGCGKKGEKSSFVRIVADEQGRVFLDLSGKAGGRGAYLCRDIACLEKAKKRHAFSRSFRKEIGENLIAELEKDFFEITKV